MERCPRIFDTVTRSTPANRRRVAPVCRSVCQEAFRMPAFRNISSRCSPAAYGFFGFKELCGWGKTQGLSRAESKERRRKRAWSLNGTRRVWLLLLKGMVKVLVSKLTCSHLKKKLFTRTQAGFNGKMYFLPSLGRYSCRSRYEYCPSKKP